MNWHRSSLHDRNRKAIKEGGHVWNSGGRCTRCFESTTAETLSLKCPGKASVPIDNGTRAAEEAERDG